MWVNVVLRELLYKSLTSLALYYRYDVLPAGPCSTDMRMVVSLLYGMVHERMKIDARKGLLCYF